LVPASEFEFDVAVAVDGIEAAPAAPPPFAALSAAPLALRATTTVGAGSEEKRPSEGLVE